MPRGASVSRTSSTKPTAFVRNVVPDRLDLRDRSYQPAVQVIPKPAMQPIYNLPVLYQGDFQIIANLLYAGEENI